MGLSEVGDDVDVVLPLAVFLAYLGAVTDLVSDIGRGQDPGLLGPSECSQEGPASALRSASAAANSPPAEPFPPQRGETI